MIKITTKKELFKAISGKTIYVWAGTVFIKVTRKALTESLRGKTKINIIYETGKHFIRLGIN